MYDIIGVYKTYYSGGDLRHFLKTCNCTVLASVGTLCRNSWNDFGVKKKKVHAK